MYLSAPEMALSTWGAITNAELYMYLFTLCNVFTLITFYADPASFWSVVLGWILDVFHR